MQMWAVSQLPVYAVEKGSGSRQKTDKQLKDQRVETAPPPPVVLPVPASADVTPWDHVDVPSDNNVENFLGPAIDAPPSPESIRKQMQRASVRDKHHSHSSASSSLRSLTSADRPSWENVLDAKSLSRKSSGRSTSSSMPSKDRPESVQFFSKSLFNRRGRLRRESSAQSSAANSVYSGEGGSEVLLLPPTSAPNRDSSIPSLFGLRRGSKAETSDASRKIQISGPYNFQHVAHTQKDHLPDLQRTNRQALASGFSQVRASQAPAGALKGIRADDLHFHDFSSESLPLVDEDGVGVLTEELARSTLTRPPSGIMKRSPRRLLKRSQSQDQLGMMAPPRPPRSPIDSTTPFPPLPPPRVSSRMSSRHERLDSVDRPNTSFCHPQPFPYMSDAVSPPATSYGYVPGPDMGVIPEHISAHIRSPSGDANWPLPSPSANASEHTLPDVPEEEETTFVSRKSRASVASNSSLRGSVSVPMLRGFSLRNNEDEIRRESQASETLGRFDLIAAQRSLEAVLNEGTDGLIRDSWEDDIDYCYEHAAEADCDYEWQRPSFELSRDSATPVDDHDRRTESCDVSPTMLSAARFDVPALSPVSQLSATGQEAITPTIITNPSASNFSLPLNESKRLRKPSDASSFKECHGFTLSPSLLIPMDFQQQMLACEAERDEDHDVALRNFDDPSHRYRTSASTTGTYESTHSGFEKHISAASTMTDFTQLTASTASLDTDSYPLKTEAFPTLESGVMPTLPESEEVIKPATRRREFRSRGSEGNLLQLATEETWPAKSKSFTQAKRGRARTASLSTPPPPNQYTLFPSVQLTGNRI
ncbi:hypothetical protein QBC40DRAFT_177327 [Triangularia verruculosa]|uniref:CRIB domain-containing protein n=1 Tax=Triangularia verruculosa TaxID=2587418 RepID=A0AAN6XEI4_9PEZI|nr:hypothetical protein QBC40DRAFT_177327 [Triangularia verruculosa]